MRRFFATFAFVLAALAVGGVVGAKTEDVKTNKAAGARLSIAIELVNALPIGSAVQKSLAEASRHFAADLLSAYEGSATLRPKIEPLLNSPAHRTRVLDIFAQEYRSEMEARIPALKHRAAEFYADRLTSEQLGILLRCVHKEPCVHLTFAVPPITGVLADAGEKLGMAAGSIAEDKGLARAQAELAPTTNAPKQ